MYSMTEPMIVVPAVTRLRSRLLHHTKANFEEIRVGRKESGLLKG
jgi:hypothetical protein